VHSVATPICFTDVDFFSFRCESTSFHFVESRADLVAATSLLLSRLLSLCSISFFLAAISLLLCPHTYPSICIHPSIPDGWVYISWPLFLFLTAISLLLWTHTYPSIYSTSMYGSVCEYIGFHFFASRVDLIAAYHVASFNPLYLSIHLFHTSMYCSVCEYIAFHLFGSRVDLIAAYLVAFLNPQVSTGWRRLIGSLIFMGHFPPK